MRGLHDYDRRGVHASLGATIDTGHWYAIEHQRIANNGLRDHGTQVESLNNPKQIDDHTIEIAGTTTDGRTFRCTVEFVIKEARQLVSVAKTTVEGSVDMGPLPASLVRVEKAVSTVLAAMTELNYASNSVLEMRRHYLAHVQPELENWKQGTPVDKQRLRSTLRLAVERADRVRSDLPRELREAVAPGATEPLHKLLDEARKALGAASRDVK